MPKTILAIALALMAGAATVQAQPKVGEEDARRWSQEAMGYVFGCRPLPSWMTERDCQGEIAIFVREYVDAMAGGYQAQRNTAQMLVPPGRAIPGDPRVLIRSDPIQGCAWRLVIAASGHPNTRQTDATNLQMDCSALTPADLSLAQRRAERIMLEIQAGQVAALGGRLRN